MAYKVTVHIPHRLSNLPEEELAIIFCQASPLPLVLYQLVETLATDVLLHKDYHVLALLLEVSVQFGEVLTVQNLEALNLLPNRLPLHFL